MSDIASRTARTAGHTLALGRVVRQMNAVHPGRQVRLDMLGDLVDAWMTVGRFLADGH